MSSGGYWCCIEMNGYSSGGDTGRGLSTCSCASVCALFVNTLRIGR